MIKTQIIGKVFNGGDNAASLEPQGLQKLVRDLNISYEQGKILSQIQNQAEILDTDYGDKAIKLKIRGKEDSIKRLFK